MQHVNAPRMWFVINLRDEAGCPSARVRACSCYEPYGDVLRREGDERPSAALAESVFNLAALAEL